MSSDYHGMVATMNAFPVRVSNEGLVTWQFHLVVESSCNKLDMTLFPFDTQMCTIWLNCRTSSVREVLFKETMPSNTTDNFLLNGEFVVRNTSVVASTMNGADREFPRVAFYLFTERRPAFYVLNMIMPCIGLVLIGLLAFCLPVTSGERVSLQITMILSFSIYQLMLSDYIPNTSNNIPIFCKYIAATIMQLVNLISLFHMF